MNIVPLRPAHSFPHQVRHPRVFGGGHQITPPQREGLSDDHCRDIGSDLALAGTVAAIYIALFAPHAGEFSYFEDEHGSWLSYKNRCPEEVEFSISCDGWDRLAVARLLKYAIISVVVPAYWDDVPRGPHFEATLLPILELAAQLRRDHAARTNRSRRPNKRNGLAIPKLGASFDEHALFLMEEREEGTFHVPIRFGKGGWWEAYEADRQNTLARLLDLLARLPEVLSQSRPGDNLLPAA